MMEMVIQGIASFLALFGFSLFLGVPSRYLFFAGTAGSVGWLAYLLTLEAGYSLTFAAFMSSLAAAVLSHVYARKLKAPVTVFLVAGIIPTVPGASVYRCVYYLIQEDAQLSSFYLIQTIQIAGAMALAIFIVDSVFRLIRKERS